MFLELPWNKSHQNSRRELRNLSSILSGAVGQLMLLSNVKSLILFLLSLLSILFIGTHAVDNRVSNRKTTMMFTFFFSIVITPLYYMMIKMRLSFTLMHAYSILCKIFVVTG